MVLIIWAGAKLLADPTNPAAVLVLFSGIFVIAKHLGNIRRILAGNENLLADGPLFHVMPGKLVLAAGSAWLGMGLFFTFVTGLGTFGAFELLVMEEPRPYWLPAPESELTHLTPSFRWVWRFAPKRAPSLPAAMSRMQVMV